MKKHLFILLVTWTVFSQFACTRVKESEPVLPVDTTKAPLPVLSLGVKEDSSATIDLSSILPQNEPYTLQFGTLLHGEIVMQAGGKSLQYKSKSTGWKSDSTTYQFCRKGICRTGFLKVINLDFKDSVMVSDTTLIPDVGPFYMGYLSSLEETLVPAGVNGKIISLTHLYYTANIQTPDSTKILYYSAGGGTAGTFGFDDVTYLIKAENGDVYKGRFGIIIGDTCEAQARNDTYQVTGNSMTWLASTWFQNDEPCFSTEENYQIRISPDTYTDYLKLPTPNGEITDTIEAGVQKLKYRRTNLSATGDTFWYYVKAGFNNRITRARIQLVFP